MLWGCCEVTCPAIQLRFFSGQIKIITAQEIITFDKITDVGKRGNATNNPLNGTN